MADTSTAVANSAIFLLGDNQPPVTGVAPNFDNSAAGQALAQLYGPCVATVGRQFGWDFSRNTYTLVLSGNPAPVPWTYEYIYPPNGVQIRQLMPDALVDPNDPLPINWNIANTEVAGTQTKVIQCDLASALALYSNQPTEATWDPLFREAVVRLLASELASALAGRPDTARDMLQSGAEFENIGQMRRD